MRETTGRRSKSATRQAVVLGLLVTWWSVLVVAEPVRALEERVARWIELRSQTAAEQRAWTEQQQHLRNELALLEREEAVTQGHLAELEDLLSPVKHEQAELETRQTVLRQALGDLIPAVSRAEADLREWEIRVPDSIPDPLREAFGRLPANAEAAARLPVTRRLQLVLALYGELESLQQEIRAAKELLTTDSGRRVEADVLYIGLARAFAVAPDDRWAAVGRPGSSGWSWESRPEIAAQVRTALRVTTRQEPAVLVRLPLAVPAAASAEPGQEAVP